MSGPTWNHRLDSWKLDLMHRSFRNGQIISYFRRRFEWKIGNSPGSEWRGGKLGSCRVLLKLQRFATAWNCNIAASGREPGKSAASP